jgi:hypothetical protein
LRVRATRVIAGWVLALSELAPATIDSIGWQPVIARFASSISAHFGVQYPDLGSLGSASDEEVEASSAAALLTNAPLREVLGEEFADNHQRRSAVVSRVVSELGQLAAQLDNGVTDPRELAGRGRFSITRAQAVSFDDVYEPDREAETLAALASIRCQVV